MTLLVNERDRTSIFVCSLVAFGWFSGALTNETKSVRYKILRFRYIEVHSYTFYYTKGKKILFVIIPRTPLYRGRYIEVPSASFVGIKLFLPGAVTIGKFCFVSFPAFRKKTREPSDSGSQFETF